MAIILGSGLREVAASLKADVEIPYARIPHFPLPTVSGHSGALALGRWGNVSVAVLEGRLHLYEGYSPAQVVFPARVLALAGARCLIATCAAGGIHPCATPGGFMIFSDHLNFQGSSPLAGAHDARWGERFVDLSQAYDPDLGRAARRAAATLRLKCFEGVYAALFGPNYETPAEIRTLRKLGADAVGMSTVPEVIAARQAGLRVLAIATISNRAAGLSKRPLSHQEVLEAGAKASKNFARLLDALFDAW